MTTVLNLLTGRGGPGLRRLAGPNDDRHVRDVVAIESLAAMRTARPGSLVVVIRSVAMSAPGYELDVAIRHATDHRLAALVLIGRFDLPITSASLADRAGLPVLAADGEVEVADLVLRIDRLLRGGSADILARAEAALDAVAAAADPQSGVEDLLAAVSDVLNVPLDYIEDEVHGASSGLPGTVTVRGTVIGAVHAQDQPGGPAALVLPALAAAVGRIMDRELGRRYAPARSRADLLAQILVAERSQLPLLIAQARDLGLQVDGTHVAVAVLVRGTGTGPGTDDEVARRRRLLDAMEIAALQVLPGRGQWNVLRPPDSLVVVHTASSAPARLTAQVRSDMQAVIDRFAPDNGIGIASGIGTPQPGIDGLRQSAHEANGAAEAAHRRGRFGVVTVFDESGLRRMLAELSASPLSRRLFDEALEALDAQGPVRSDRAVRTLAAYLDAEGSPTRAAATLNLHPNAVSYRIRQIVGRLGVDLSLPDTRLVLHLACRARLLDL